MAVAADLPPSFVLINPPALIAKAQVRMSERGNVRLSNEPGYKKVITSCVDVPGLGYLDPERNVIAYLGYRFDYKTKAFKPALNINDDIKTSIIQQPKFGKIVGEGPSGMENYGYRTSRTMPDGTPELGIVDKVIYLVEIKEQKFKVVFNLLNVPGSDRIHGDQACEYKRFSMADMPDPSLDLWLAAAELSSLLAEASGITLSFTDLPATAIGQTVGEGLTTQITLDTNAAGHNWYIDPTPLDSSDDYLPTSNPEVWQAKAGSAAAGKMDMLSVLLHEYGHALGLEHSGAASDFMAASLQPGVRKLPSAAELTWMSQLVAELKSAGGEALTLALSQGERGQVQGEREQDNPSSPSPSPLSALGLLPFGFMRRNDGKGSANAAVATGAATATQTDYLTAINTTLANGSLHAGQTASIDQWQSVGNVAATPATASQGVTLGESTTAQAHLAQAFILSAQDRFLTFTVSGLDLQTNSTEQNGVFTAAPQDAFEVALQNANTGANLLANGAGGVGNYPF